MTSILDSDYIHQNRPYSQDELRDNRIKLYKSLRLSTTKAWHSRCKHFYYVRQNGKKEREILASENNDCGNCSVCWKLHKCGRTNKHRANNMVDEYSNSFFDDPKYITYNLCDLETVFYKWLYDDGIHSGSGGQETGGQETGGQETGGHGKNRHRKPYNS